MSKAINLTAEQLELALDDWRLLCSAPRDATWMIVKLRDGKEVKAHWAQDLSGEEQPPFRGFFVRHGTYFREAFPDPICWKPLPHGNRGNTL